MMRIVGSAIACLLAAFLAGGCHTVSMDSNPPGAQVFVDGEYWGTTPCTHTWVLGQKAGGFTAAMVLPGYQYSDCPLLPRGTTIAPDETLMTSAPGGAQVFVNGTYVGNSPIFRNLFFPASIRAAWPKDAAAAATPPAKPPAEAQVASANALAGVRRRYAVIIGINDYKFRGKWNLGNLRYAVEDAKALSEYLQDPAGGRFDNVLFLADQQATTTNIKVALRENLREAQKDDLVVIYWSGHGGADPHDAKSLYLITHDTDPEHMASTAYAMDEFKADLGRLQPQRVLILADTCHSAGITDPRIGARGQQPNKIVEGIKGVYVAPAKPDTPGPIWMIFTSCEAGEVSLESSDLSGGHGAFTHYLLEGLKGKADLTKSGGNGDGKVDLGEVIEYTRDQVKRFTRNQQHPDTAGRFDRNLVLGQSK
jgi:uncharacterized caspase-like protein